MKLSDTNVAIMGNSTVFPFLKNFFRSLIDCKQMPRKVYLGDTGLGEGNLNFLKSVCPVLVVVPLAKFENKMRTHDSNYKKMIRHRICLLKRIAEDHPDVPILQLDADTEVLSSEFPLVQADVDVVLHVRDAPELHPGGKNYPNCGVIFWMQPERCIPFWNEWEKAYSQPLHARGQYEQYFFHLARKTEAWRKLKCQQLHCRYYNCYQPTWVNKRTAILHFKSLAGGDTPETRMGRFGAVKEKWRKGKVPA